ncbi:MAG: FecR domain-containing protein [Prolixibacteraceae bacterium]
METQESIHTLILRLFSGEADTNEKIKIAEWLEKSVENRKLYSDLRDIWLSTGVQNNADQYNLDKAIQQFRDHIRQAAIRPKKENQMIRFLVKYAAIIILVLSLPLSYFFGTRNTPKQSMTTICCAYGDKSNVLLPDSSRVWLNSGSKISFNSDFKYGGRNVTLEGEAYFSVSKDKDHPFRIRTSDVEIKVLGTQFNVKAYPEEKYVSTTLAEGSLQFSGNNEERIIKPNEKLIFDKETKKMTLNKLADISSEIDWKKGRLVFRNESLEELEPKLERWFDVDIVFADERVRHRKFTGTLERESILEVISYFELSKYVSCKIQGNQIIIKTKTAI